MYSTHPEDDLSLWRKFKHGNAHAFQEIYERYIRRLSVYCLRFTSDKELIEDVLHDVFVQLWNKRDALGETTSIIKYLTVTVRREMVRRVQLSYKISGFDKTENADLGFSLSAEDAIVFEEMDQENAVRLTKAMESLSARQKEALYLKYFENRSYDEISEIMDINYQSVRNLISKGIIEMRKMLFLLTVVIILSLHEYKISFFSLLPM